MPSLTAAITMHPARGRQGEHQATYRRLRMAEGATDLTLAPGSHLTEWTTPGTALLLLPLVGRLEVETEHELRQIVPGQYLLLDPPTASIVRFRNTGEQLINYWQFTLPAAAWTGSVVVHDFGERLANPGLHTVLHTPRAALHLGLLGGRQEGALPRSFPEGRCFVGGAAGAMEVQERLLRERDALTVTGGGADVVLEYECLSQQATLVVLETAR